MTEQARNPEGIPCYYGSVNRWECDENGHLNVRFFLQKITQATEIYLRGVAGSADLVASSTLRSHHIRFIREARIATPLRVDCSLATVDSSGFEVLSLLRHNLSDEPLAAFLSRFNTAELPLEKFPEPVFVPDWAGPRGLDPNEPYPLQTSIRSAIGAGFQSMGRGIIDRIDCGNDGLAVPQTVIGRISDGMPNFWAFLSDVESASLREEGELGGAALEYRLSYHAPLQAGDAFQQLSGIKALGNKTQHMVHMLFNESRGELAASAEAIGVAMDLLTRRAVPISTGRRQRMQALMLAE